MSFLTDKYNVPEETIKAMIKNGVISCSWQTYEEVYALWKRGMSARDIAAETGRGVTTIYDIIRLFREKP